jgi:DNA-directed RNA polymerase subunit RPC12/RpoP
VQSSFFCVTCDKSYPLETTDQELIEEKNFLFPNSEEEDLYMVCEDCFIKIMEFNEPDDERWRKFTKSK